MTILSILVADRHKRVHISFIRCYLRVINEIETG